MSAILTRAFMAAFCTSALTEFTQIGALLIDGLITSRYLGAEKMAAVGIAAPFFFLVGIIGTSIAVGLQTVCTKEMGAGNTGRMNYIFNETLEAALAVALAFSFLVYMEAPPMAAMFGARGRAILLLDETIEYLHGLVGEVVPYVLLSVITPLVLLDNGNRIVMISSVTGAVSNIFLDILFVRLDFGIWGMGMATSLSVIFSLLVLLSHFLRKNRILRLKPVPINLTNIGRILILSGPRAIHQAAGMLRPIVLNSLVVAVGGRMAMSAMSIRASISDFVDIPAVGIAGAVSLLAGIGYGEVNGEDIESVGRIAHRFIAVSASVITVLLLFFARPIAVFYLGESSPALSLTAFAIRTIAVGTLFSELIYVRISYLQAIEQIRSAHLIEICVNLVCLLGFAILLSFPFGIYGVFAAFPLSQFIVLLAIMLSYSVKTKKLIPDWRAYAGLDPSFFKRPEEEIAYSFETIEHCCLASEQVYLFCRGHKMGKNKALHASLCMEEIMTNVIEHGFFKKAKDNHAEIRVTISGGTLILRVRDNGREFDLSSLAKILTDDRDPYSNIGIKLICRNAKDIHYYRIWGMNTTILEV